MLALSLGATGPFISPSFCTVPVSSMSEQMLMSVPFTPGEVAPPLLPLNVGAHGGAYTDSIWRGGFPKPYGQSLATCLGGGGGGAATCCASWVTPPGVPLDACWKEEKTDDWFLSGGASGEKPLLVVGCSRGGRRMLGRIAIPSTSATAR